MFKDKVLKKYQVDNIDMDYTEEEIKNAAETEHWINKRIFEMEEEISRLKGVLLMLDLILKKTSFQKAADLLPTKKEKKIDVSHIKSTSSSEFTEIRPLTSSKNDLLLANMYISESSVAIVPVSDIVFKISTPPFNSFLVNRILEGMKSKDLESVSNGNLNEIEVLKYSIEDDNEVIKKIIISNYRDQSRLVELMNTFTWTFTRMLEKTK